MRAMNISPEDIYNEIKDKKPIPPCSFEELPDDPELPEGAREIELQDTRFGIMEFFTDVVYAERDGVELHLQILMPINMHEVTDKRLPLIVFVPGSAWMPQMKFSHIAELIYMAQNGYIVASVEYRHSGIAPAPAQAEDCKTAVRYMRLHAKEYHADPDKVILWGDSSGGHTVLMAGFSGDNAPDTDLYKEVSCEVSCIVDWFGPTLLPLMNYYPSIMDHIGGDSPEGRVLGADDVTKALDKAAEASPMNYLSRERATPPLLIMHGSRDQLVPFNQSVRLYKVMKEMGKEVEFIKLKGGAHEFGGFRCEEALEIVDEFIKRHI